MANIEMLKNEHDYTNNVDQIKLGRISDFSSENIHLNLAAEEAILRQFPFTCCRARGCSCYWKADLASSRPGLLRVLWRFENCIVGRPQYPAEINWSLIGECVNGLFPRAIMYSSLLPGRTNVFTIF